MEGEHGNAGEATVEEQREGDFTHGEPAGPYGGTDETGGERPEGTGEAEQVEHVGDRETEGSDGEGQDGQDAAEGEGDGDGGDGEGDAGGGGDGSGE